MIVFIMIARLYRNQTAGRVTKKRRREDLLRALQLIIQANAVSTPVKPRSRWQKAIRSLRKMQLLFRSATRFLVVSSANGTERIKQRTLSNPNVQ